MEPDDLATLGDCFVAFLLQIGRLANNITALSPIKIKKIVRKTIIILYPFIDV